jgi:hypothetical protein
MKGTFWVGWLVISVLAENHRLSPSNSIAQSIGEVFDWIQKSRKFEQEFITPFQTLVVFAS